MDPKEDIERAESAFQSATDAQGVVLGHWQEYQRLLIAANAAKKAAWEDLQRTRQTHRAFLDSLILAASAERLAARAKNRVLERDRRRAADARAVADRQDAIAAQELRLRADQRNASALAREARRRGSLAIGLDGDFPFDRDERAGISLRYESDEILAAWWSCRPADIRAIRGREHPLYHEMLDAHECEERRPRDGTGLPPSVRVEHGYPPAH